MEAREREREANRKRESGRMKFHSRNNTKYQKQKHKKSPDLMVLSIQFSYITLFYIMVCILKIE